MTRSEWKQIALAGELLGLAEEATLADIKKAYRSLCKIHHPDMRGGGSEEANEYISRLTQAYEILLAYCSEYRFPLTAPEGEDVEPDDWWLDRFGQDPLWGKGKK